MKKIIILLVLIFNLIPVFKNGEINFIDSNVLIAQSMATEVEDIEQCNGYHVVWWSDNTWTWYIEQSAQEDLDALRTIAWDEAVEQNHEDMIDPVDGYWHVYRYEYEYIYEWDERDRQWQLVANNNPNTPMKPKYYITLNSETHRYYDGDKIYVQKQNTPITLTIHNENMPSWSSGDFVWKRKKIIDTAKCATLINCNFDVSTVGVTEVRVDSAGVKTLIKNPLIVNDKPTIIFQREYFYSGRYGFDDSSHKHYDLRANPIYSNGLEVRKINSDTAYVVPWMSAPSPSVNIVRIKKINLDSSLANDPNFWVDFRITTNSISIQGGAFHMNYAQLNALDEINLGTTEWTNNLDSLRFYGDYNALVKSIYAVTNTGDTIGKLNISTSHLEDKQVVFVYVNSGTGYNNNPALQKTNLLSRLNNNSHGQLLRKWVLNTSYSDTLDMSSEYSANPNWFVKANDSIYPELFRTYYLTHKGIDIHAINTPFYPNLPGQVHFYFITKFSLIDSTYSGSTLSTTTTEGVTFWNRTYGAIFSNGVSAVPHEFGHVLHIEHTFPEGAPGSPYNIPKYSTTNFMDYLRAGEINMRDMFYYTQWIDVR